MPHDDNLVKRARNGDAEAFASLLGSHYDMMYRTAYKWCGNQHDAEDIAQDACIQIGQSIKNFRGDCAFSSWVYRIVVNKVHDRGRKYKQHLDMEVLDTVVGSGALEIENNVTHQELWHNVQQLPDKQRTAVLLVYSEDLNHAQVAEIMECKESTVSWYIHEAKKQLGRVMQHQGREQHG